MSKRVGVVYDPVFLEHDTGEHVENQQRLVAVQQVLTECGLLQELVPLGAPAVSVEVLRLLHSEGQVRLIEHMARGGGGWLDPDTYVSPRSYQVALQAAGGTIRALEAVLKREVDAAFALVRPPGHHATPTRSMGFCLFNNLALAAAVALREHSLERVLVVDYDVHHGNGTQDAFYSDPRVLYFSLHQYPFYPGTGNYDEMGEGAGKGYTLNVPLPAYCGDAEYLRVFSEVLVPAAERYKPELVLVSAGYDSHWGDPLAMMQTSVEGFRRMAKVIQGIATAYCKGRVVYALEGGYHLKGMPYGVAATLNLLLGRESIPDPMGHAPALRPPSIEGMLRVVREAHKL